jgi:hypothetical protein
MFVAQEFWTINQCLYSQEFETWHSALGHDVQTSPRAAEHNPDLELADCADRRVLCCCRCVIGSLRHHLHQQTCASVLGRTGMFCCLSGAPEVEHALLQSSTRQDSRHQGKSAGGRGNTHGPPISLGALPHGAVASVLRQLPFRYVSRIAQRGSLAYRRADLACVLLQPVQSVLHAAPAVRSMRPWHASCKH